MEIYYNLRYDAPLKVLGVEPYANDLLAKAIIKIYYNYFQSKEYLLKFAKDNLKYYQVNSSDKYFFPRVFGHTLNKSTLDYIVLNNILRVLYLSHCNFH